MFKTKKIFTFVGFLIMIAIISISVITIFGVNYYYKTKQVNEAVLNKKVQMSYSTNIVKDTEQNTYFRKVLFTGQRSQLVVMDIPLGGEVGEETHNYVEQILFFLSGTGKAILDGKESPVSAGDVFVVTPGTKHNFINTGTESLKIYTVYTPSNHVDGRIQATKAEADKDVQDEAFGQAVR